MAQILDLRTGSLQEHSFRARRLQAGAGESGGFRLEKLDFTRIAAEAGAIAINAAALLLLLAPLSPHLPPAADKPEDTVIVPITPKRPPPKIVDRVDVVKPPKTPPVVPTTVTPPKVEMQPPPLVEPIPGDIAADSALVARTDTGSGIAITEPLPGVHLEYAVAPPPAYPREAMRDGLTGTVTLRVLVDVDGQPIEVQIERSSGHRILDAAAKRHVLAKWRFKPAMRDGQAVQAIGLVPIDFTLYR